MTTADPATATTSARPTTVGKGPVPPASIVPGADAGEAVGVGCVAGSSLASASAGVEVAAGVARRVRLVAGDGAAVTGCAVAAGAGARDEAGVDRAVGMGVTRAVGAAVGVVAGVGGARAGGATDGGVAA